MTLSAPAPTVAAMHHPWQAFRELVDWTLEWAHLPPGVWGETDFDRRTVTLTHGLNQAERRCTIEHERQHILRGPVDSAAYAAREEVEVDRNAARVLLPDVHQVGEALAWAHSLAEAAEELWVDEVILEARLRHLHPAEKAYLRRRLGEEPHE